MKDGGRNKRAHKLFLLFHYLHRITQKAGDCFEKLKELFPPVTPEQFAGEAGDFLYPFYVPRQLVKAFVYHFSNSCCHMPDDWYTYTL